MPAIQVMLSMEDGVLSIHSSADPEMQWALVFAAWELLFSHRVAQRVQAPAADKPRIVSVDGPLPDSLGTRRRRP